MDDCVVPLIDRLLGLIGNDEITFAAYLFPRLAASESCCALHVMRTISLISSNPDFHGQTLSLVREKLSPDSSDILQRMAAHCIVSFARFADFEGVISRLLVIAETNIASALKAINAVLAVNPGPCEPYVSAILAMLDSLLTARGEALVGISLETVSLLFPK
jgi:hypothetical protein